MVTKEELKNIHDVFLTFLEAHDKEYYDCLDSIGIDESGMLFAKYTYQRWSEWTSHTDYHEPSVLTKDLEDVTKERIERVERERIAKEEQRRKEQLELEERQKKKRFEEYQKLKKEFGEEREFDNDK